MFLPDLILAGVSCGLIATTVIYLLLVRSYFKENNYLSFVMILLITFAYSALEITLFLLLGSDAGQELLGAVYLVQQSVHFLFWLAMPLFLYANILKPAHARRVFLLMCYLGTLLMIIAYIMVAASPNNFIVASSLFDTGNFNPQLAQKGPLYYITDLIQVLFMITSLVALLIDHVRWGTFKRNRLVLSAITFGMFFGLSAVAESSLGFVIDPLFFVRFSRMTFGLTGFCVLIALGFFRIFLLQAREVSQARDALKRSERLLAQLNLTDDLTGISNRRAFLQAIDDEMGSPHAKTGLILIYLDELMDLNESFSVEYGDAVIKSFVTTIRQVIPLESSVFRLGGSEFAILTRQASSGAQLVALGQAIYELAKAGIKVDEGTQALSCSIGVNWLPDSVKDRSSVLSACWSVLRDAKKHPGQITVYSPMSHQASLEKILTIANLRHDLAEKRFSMVYQPIVNANGTIASCEALVRWQSLQKSYVSSPSIFVPLAESAGLMRDLGKLIIDMVFSDLAPYLSRPDFPPVALNLSPSQLLYAGFSDELMERLDYYKINPKKIRLEVTESILMEAGGRGSAALERFRNAGMSIAIDDFGSGYSSLGYLHRLPVDMLKLDKAFLAGIPGSKASEALVSAVADIAFAFGLSVVAEGVERREQAKFLIDHKISLFQGFLYYRPLKLNEYLEVLGHSE